MTTAERTITNIAKAARAASNPVAVLEDETRAGVLLALAEKLDANRERVLAANDEDMNEAEKNGIDSPKRKRLRLTDNSIDQLISGLNQIANAPDPVGQVTREQTLENGLHVQRQRTPLGVIAMIYEARPGVTVDAFALCFRSGNACILKGGREASRSNAILAELIRDTLTEHGVNADAMQSICDISRDEVRTMLSLSDEIDLVIPRGGENLIRFVDEHARMPTVLHYKGVCHIYVDKDADLDQAVEIITTAKTSNPATCNTVECLLIHEAIAEQLSTKLAPRLDEEGIELRGDETIRAIIPSARPATDDDWGAEYLDLILAARSVESIGDAIAHIERFGSDHTEAILTRDQHTADDFCRRVRSSCVLVNASTRFNDGFQLGLGAELGISTSRVHAYGPMGLEGLTIERWVVRGDGQTR